MFSTWELNVSSYFLRHIVPLGVIAVKIKTELTGSKWRNENEAGDDREC